jgi:hypothetical protein
MHARILHHLFHVIASDVIKAPLWDVASLGPAAFPNNAAFVHQHVSQLLATSFPNLRPQQVDVSGPSPSARRCHACLLAMTPSCHSACCGTTPAASFQGHSTCTLTLFCVCSMQVLSTSAAAAAGMVRKRNDAC